MTPAVQILWPVIVKFKLEDLQAENSHSPPLSYALQQLYYEKAIISGHYVFSDPRFQEIKNRLQAHVKSLDVDEHLTKIVRKSILRYLKHFNLLNQ